MKPKPTMAAAFLALATALTAASGRVQAQTRVAPTPAQVMRLVEIVRGTATSPATIETTQTLARRLGKVGVVVGNGPGFVGNRMMCPYMYEAQYLVEDGATPEEVARARPDWGMLLEEGGEIEGNPDKPRWIGRGPDFEARQVEAPLSGPPSPFESAVA